jgi:ribonucleoside-triphosphate reductase (thioredoxin)
MSLPTLYQEFIHISRYARWRDKEKRRETWDETVDRYLGFMGEHLEEQHSYKIDPALLEEIRSSIYNLDVMPSMRAMWSAGKALSQCNVAAYNCAYAPVDKLRTFDEILYILMCGTGVGFSVEKKYTKKLPTICEEFEYADTCITVNDSKVGWCRSYRELLSLLVAGSIPTIDYSKLRAKGSKLKTFGGRAAGPDALKALFDYTISMFKQAAGRKLHPIECHDIVCMIAEVVVCGGVRRSALISLSDLTDDRMRAAKFGQWHVIAPYRQNANNSTLYRERPDIGTFMDEWISLYRSKSGERGIINRVALKKQCERSGRRDIEWEFAVNPCGEIILRPKQFCNLTEVVVRSHDTLETLKEKVRIATIMGTYQATLTKFKHISKYWKENCEEERLLGVSFTGIMDHEVLNGSTNPTELVTWLHQLKQVSIDVNKEVSKAIGIPQSTGITTVKPSGNVSQLVDSASGIHARHSEYYIRTVRASKTDPLATMMVENGIPHENCVMNPETTWIFSFPIKSPEKAVLRTDRTAVQQMELWKVYQDHWCEHKPSITVSVKEQEWIEVSSWVWKHFDEISGIAFIPFADHSYQQAPYQDCSKKEYDELLTKMPDSFDWMKLKDYEEEDNTVGSNTLSCTAGACEVVDL